MILAAALLVIQAPAYTVQPIITDTPYFLAECYALNDESQVTYSVDLSDYGPTLGFVWKDGTSTEIVAPPGNPAETVTVLPIGINNDGTVIGIINRTIDRSISTWEGFSWTASSGTTKLMCGEYQFDPISINNNGDILGNAPNIGDDSNPLCLGILRSSHEFTPLLDYNTEKLTVPSLNDHDELAGIQNYSGYGHAFRILPGTQAIDILEMPQHVDHPIEPWKNATSVVTAVNNGGWACGFVNMKTTGQPSQDEIGAVWSPDNSFSSLGAGYKAWDINDHGVVVGSQVMGVARGHGRYSTFEASAFVYDSANGLRLLNALVPIGTPMLGKALAINNKGEILCRAQANESDWYLLKPAH